MDRIQTSPDPGIRLPDDGEIPATKTERSEKVTSWALFTAIWRGRGGTVILRETSCPRLGYIGLIVSI